MAITDIQISEELETNAPSIKYTGDEGPKSPQEMEMMADAMLKEEYEKYVYDLLEQRPDATPMSLEEFKRMVMNDQAKGPILPSPEDPVNPFGPKPQGPTLPNRQMAAFGGIMGLDGRRQYGFGSKLKKAFRKIIPNEVAKVAEVAAPFVAPFNPLAAGLMKGVGGFDRTGSIGDSLKSGLMTYGLGQGARYLGGADFQGLQNPFAKDAFSMPTGSGGIKNLFKDKGQPIQPISGGEYGQFTEPTFGAGDAIGGEGLTGAGEIISSTTATTPGSAMDSLKSVVSFETSAADKGKAALDLLKRGSKSLFYTDGKPDKAAILGAVTAAASYAEALMLAKDAGVELTEEEYDQAQRDEKKEEYAGYLQHFFGGLKNSLMKWVTIKLLYWSTQTQLTQWEQTLRRT